LDDIYDRIRNAALSAAPAGATKYLHASALISAKGKVISIGRNHYRGELIEGEFGPIKRTMHSEIHALYQVNVRRLSGATIINYACSNGPNHNAVVSRPCDTCWSILKKLGVKKVLYSAHPQNGKQVWKEERF